MRISSQTYFITLLIFATSLSEADTTDNSAKKTPSASTLSRSFISDTAGNRQRSEKPDSITPFALPWNLPASADSTQFRSDTTATALPIIDATTPTPPVLRHRKKAPSIFAPRESLYVGISPEQDYLARRYVRQTFAFSWGEAEKTAKRLLRVERKDRLPPVSALLSVSARVFRILHGEYETETEYRTLLHEINEIEEKTKRQLSVRSQPDSLVPLTLFIDGGIRGLSAALKIETNVVEAAIDGFTALDHLEHLLELSPDIDDAWLGYGLFYCSLARAPAIVRAALNIGNRPVSFDGGLDELRKSAYRGRYTSELSMLYLIQFLSPYWGHLAIEKDSIFARLQQRYPDNPYYVFLAIDEDICFHPERINSEYVEVLEKRIRLWNGTNYSLKRYQSLVRYQVNFIDSVSEPGIPLSDTAAVLREFAFYPLFLSALREHRRPKDNDAALLRKRNHLTKEASAVMRSLGLSTMSSARKNFYEWHIRDALKLR